MSLPEARSDGVYRALRTSNIKLVETKSNIKPGWRRPAARSGKRDSTARRAGNLRFKGGQQMPQQAWSKKRERQYQHIKKGAMDQGSSESRAEEISARTVNKERAQQGESTTASRLSKKDISPGRRGGKRSHSGPAGRTKDQLYAEARKKNIKGRSTMNKAQLEKAVGRN